MSAQTRSLSVQSILLAYQQVRYRWMILVAVLAALAGFLLLGISSASSHSIPTISVLSVRRGESVTIRTHNFPANHVFTVTMGKMGTRGVGGAFVTNISSGAGGSTEWTFNIPEALKNDHQVAIRLQTGHANPYYAFNWFYNAVGGQGAQQPPSVAPAYTGIPTFKITAVQRNTQVTIETNNFPPNQNFTVTMGHFGTRGVGGMVVGTIPPGAGGTATYTFAIPSGLTNLNRIAIRAQTAHANPYYAFNWFHNNDANVPATAGAGSAQPAVIPQTPAFVGIPTFTVCSVAQNNTVTIVTSALPANQTFHVTMGVMYTQGIGGYSAGSFVSDNGAAQRLTFGIPAQLHGLRRISIRAQTGHAAPFFAYNWFYNNSATVC
ncbi:MAG: hypothetical protein AAF614_31005 [Chloroflexota bacterium]